MRTCTKTKFWEKFRQFIYCSKGFVHMLHLKNLLAQMTNEEVTNAGG